MKVDIIDLAKRLIKWESKLDIYSNGADNAYTERTERLINNSVTAKTASNIMVQYLLGKGFGDADNLRLGGVKLIDFAEDIAQDIIENRGVFIHVNYDLNYDFTSLKVLPFGWCRIGKKDSRKYNGKILIKSDWTDKKEEPQIINVYNPKKEVIEAQIKAVKGIENYNGQVFYYNLESKYYYPLSRIDSVMNDCDSEAQSAVYKNQLLRKGFFGKTLVVTRPLIDNTIAETILNEQSQSIINPLYRQAESEAKQTKETIEKFIGAENAGGAMLLEMEFAGDKFEDAILIKNIESNITPDLFKNVETSVRENILIAFNNLPVGLIRASDGIFSNSGTAIAEMKKMYWENTSKERNILETIVNDLMKGFAGYDGAYLSILPLMQKEVSNDDANAQKLAAQAALKGSVGGVQGLLAIQASVSQGLTDYESAITIISEIFGIPDELARQMLGTPKVKQY